MMRTTIGTTVMLLLVTSCGPATTQPLGAGPAAPQPPLPAGRTIWENVFTLQQARRGEMIADSQCKLCHSTDIEWPLLVERWKGRNLGELYQLVRTTMPQNFPGGLRAQEYADVLAYILRLNRAPPGDADLPANERELANIAITAP